MNLDGIHPSTRTECPSGALTELSELSGLESFSRREANEEEIDEQAAAGFIALQNWDGI
jgi:hypothetical protein